MRRPFNFASLLRSLPLLLLAFSAAALIFPTSSTFAYTAEQAPPAEPPIDPLPVPFDRPLSAPQASVSLNFPGSVLIGEDFSFTATFDNNGSDPGYGPFIDLVFPINGVDGAAGTDTPDGIDFINANYLGVGVTTFELTFPDDGGGVGCVDHPLALDNTGVPHLVCGTTGDKLVVIQLPFGSFVPTQPPAEVTINASLSNLADLGTPLSIRARAGFQFGANPLDDPCCDLVILNPSTSNSGSWPSSSTTPTLISLSKSYDGPEDETATGPNFEREYTINVNVAAGQTITDLDVFDLLPPNMAYTGVVSTSPGGSSIIQEPTIAAAANPPNNILQVNFPSVMGPAGASITFTYFIPALDADGNPVLDPSSGDDEVSQNTASALGDWTPVDPRDAGGTDNAVADPAGFEHELNDRSVAIQKDGNVFADTGAAGPSPGDTLQFTLSFQISDYFTFGDLIVTDSFTDGHRLDPAFIPTLTVTDRSGTTSGAFLIGSDLIVDTTEIGNDPDPATDGSTTLTFDISAAMVRLGAPDGILQGGRAITPDATGATGTITFRTIIQENFSDTYPSGDPSIDHGDVLGNDVTIAGSIRDNNSIGTTIGGEADTSAAGTTIVRGDLEKEIYAVNGSTSLGDPVQVKPGDEVTYRLRYTLPSTDFEDLYFIDYLPLPIFLATEVTSFDTTVSAAAPPAGSAKFGPLETSFTVHGITPSISSSAAENSLRFDIGTFDDPADRSTVVDLLFTVTVQNDPFADGLYLTNQARSHEGSTNAGDQNSDQIVQLILQEPYLQITKGAVSTDNSNDVFDPTTTGPTPFTSPGSSGPRWSGTIDSLDLASAPIDSDLSNVDAGDTVTFAVVIENLGSSPKGAFDIIIKDTVPAGFDFPSTPAGLNLSITRGDQTNIGYTALGPSNDATDLFANGLELIDPSVNEGACQVYDPNNGANLIVITYDLILQPDAEPLSVLTNLAQVTQYANEDGLGPTDNFVADQNLYQDDASTTVASPLVVKTVIATNQVHTSGLNVAIGEIVTYQAVITVPEGTSSTVTLVDTLDSGLAFVSLDTLTVSDAGALSTDVSGGFPAVLTNAQAGLSSPGSSASFNFGTITNTDADNTTPETITLTYQVVVLNTVTNTRDIKRNNLATWIWSVGSVTGSAPNVVIVEPTLEVIKAALPNSGDAGDTITFTLTIQHTTASNSTAFELALSDVVPTDMTYTASSLVHTAGLAPTSLDDSAAPTLTASWDQAAGFPVGTTSQFQFQATLNNDVIPGQTITNDAVLTWTGLPGDVTTPQSSYNSVSTERTGNTGNPGGAANTYTHTGSVDVNVIPGLDKFIVTTSESHTTDAAPWPLAIGEIIRYRVQVALPEGVAPTFQISDSLPTGLLYLNDGTSKVAFVSDDPSGGITSSTLSGAGLSVNGDETSVATITPTFILPGGAISGGPFNPGTDPTFSLGDLTNADRDVNLEYVVLEFNALLSNISTNTAGTTRSNTYQVIIDGLIKGTSNAISALVVEPSLNVTKVVSTAPQDAGDTLIYTITIQALSGANRASAFELDLTDTLDSNLVLQGVTPSSVPAYSTLVDNSILASNLVSVEIDRLDPGDSVVLLVEATVAALAPTGETIPNTVDLLYSSLPDTGTSPNGTGSSTPGGSGDGDGERDGSGTGANAYSSTDSVDHTLETPSVDKQLSPTGYVIGEQVTFDLLVTLTEGVTRDLVVFDNLPVGLEYVSHQVITSAAASGGLLSADFAGSLPVPTVTAPGGSGGDLTLTFGDTTTTDDNNAANNAFLVQLQATVLNVASNQNGTSLDNLLELRYTANGSPATETDTVSLTILEPELQIAKSADDDTTTFNQTVTYEITISHLGTSTADAFDLVISDAVPIGLNYIGPVSPLPAGWTLDDSAAPTLEFSASSLTTAAGSVTLRYQATLGEPPAVTVGNTFTNTANLTWTSLSGVVTSERTGSGTPAVNNYTDSSSEVITASAVELTLSKDDGGISVTPGDTYAYTIDVNNTGNIDATGVVITDTVPDYTTFNSAASSAGWSCAPDNSAGSTCTYTQGNLAAASGITLTFAVTVDSTLPVTVDITSNTASVSGTNEPTQLQGNNQDTDNTPLIAAPDLTITKDDGIDTVSPGEVLNFTLSFSNIGDQDASGVEITDEVPSNTVFNAAASTPGWSCDDPDGSGPLGPGDPGSTCTFLPDTGRGTGNIPAGDSGSVQFALTVDDPFPVGVSLVINSASITDDGSNGPDQNPGNNTDNDRDNVVTLGDVDINKSLFATSQAHTDPGDTQLNSNPPVAVGEILTYEIVLNLPPGTITNVVLTDQLDRGLAFVDCLSITPSSSNIETSLPGGFGAACSPNPTSPTLGNPAIQATGAADEDQGRTIVFDLGDMTNTNDPATGSDETLTIRYTVVVIDNLANARGLALNNAVLWQWDTGSLSTSAGDATIVEPTLTLEKTAAPRIVPPGTPITFTLTVGHAASSDSDAFDLVLTDVLPPQLSYVPGSLNCTSGTCTEAAGTITVTWGTFALGGTSSIEFQATLGNVAPGERVANEVALEWTSLPDDSVSTPFSLSDYNPLAVERRYDPTAPADAYRVVASVLVGAPALPETGFAPDQRTDLPPAPAQLPYESIGEFRLVIPKLNLSKPIVGVATDDYGWDLTWLWNNVGYLEGTAFPTLPGNTALTAHVVLPNGVPGPFARLNELDWKDEIQLQTEAGIYIYQVVYSWSTHARDLSVLRHEELDFITLITCMDFDSRAGTYRQRLAVRAVLVEVK
jgi:LPXTG-site transpeptidase (sortase) family protein